MISGIFSLPVDFATTTLSFVSGVVGDLKLLILIIFAVGIGTWIAGRIIGNFSRGKE